MFIAALFITAQTWKQPECPSVGEWVNCTSSRHRGVLLSDKSEGATKPREDVGRGGN